MAVNDWGSGQGQDRGQGQGPYPGRNWRKVLFWLQKHPLPAVVALLVIVAVGVTMLRGRTWMSGIIRPHTPQVVAFYQSGWTDLDQGLPALKANYQHIDILSPFWYTVESDGSIRPRDVDPAVIAFAKQKRIPIHPLFNKGEGTAMLTDPAARARAARGIADIVDQNGYAGVNIDLQPLTPDLRDEFTAFVRDVANRLHPQGKMVSVSLFPKVGVPAQVTAAYDQRTLARYCDFLMLMAYDRHSTGSPPGPVAPADWVEENIKWSLSNGVPRHKLVLGIATYGYDWHDSQPGAQTVGLKEAVQKARATGADIRYDNSTKSLFFSYYPGQSVPRNVWFEGGDSAMQKAELARKYGLMGVGIWRVGYESGYFWQKLEEALNRGGKARH
ncbi:MAG: glycoside hydrolase family 18 [Limnochordaceae bacterium]|nr:glycoside hydrolase family 18 [Limnochordaceae bacterium]